MNSTGTVSVIFFFFFFLEFKCSIKELLFQEITRLEILTLCSEHASEEVSDKLGK